LVYNALLKRIEYLAGKICEVILPIRDTVHIGKGSSIAVCTLASIDLLKSIAEDEYIMQSIAVVGRLLSENKGIDMLVNFIAEHKEIRYLILCGNDTKGHYAGQALLALYKNGINNDGRIVGAIGKHPIVSVSMDKIDEFRTRINVIDMIGVKDKEKIRACIESLLSSKL
jgi:tetrahydromethanopterin S-methyltransferase subunit A